MPREYERNLDEPSYFEKNHCLKIPLQETNEFRGTQFVEKHETFNGSNSAGSEGQRTTPDESAQKSEDSLNRLDELAVDMRGGTYTPIKSLNTFLFDWKIKARVTKKHLKKSWKNQRGCGSLLNIELIDMAGTQIQATFFNE